MSVPPVLIAQISDLHITPPGVKAYEVVDTAAAFARCISFLNAMRPAPAAVICTGDLAESGRAAEYAHLKEILAPLALPFFAVPGNHDSRAPMRAAFPAQPYAAGMNMIVAAGEVDLILLDSSVPGAAHGLLDPQTLAWLKTTLATSRRPAILFLHHPPFAVGVDYMDEIALQNAGEFAEIVAKHPRILHVATGHVHRSVFTLFGGVAATICPTPSHALDLDFIGARPPSLMMEPPGMHLHGWFAGGPFGRLVTHFIPVGDFEGSFPFDPQDASR